MPEPGPEPSTEEPPQNRTPQLEVESLIAHIQVSLGLLHAQCVKRNLGAEIEETLRTGLMQELEDLKALPPDLTAQELLGLDAAHYDSVLHRSTLAEEALGANPDNPDNADNL